MLEVYLFPSLILLQLLHSVSHSVLLLTHTHTHTLQGIYSIHRFSFCFLLHLFARFHNVLKFKGCPCVTTLLYSRTHTHTHTHVHTHTHGVDCQLVFLGFCLDSSSLCISFLLSFLRWHLKLVYGLARLASHFVYDVH